MYKNFKIKLIFPCRFEDNNNPYSVSYLKYLPYGMGILTAFLRKHNYYVEQEDLSIRFNSYDFHHKRLNNKVLDLDIEKYKNEINIFLEHGRIENKLKSLIVTISNLISIQNFDLIGFSIFSELHFFFALMLSKHIKQSNNAPIVFGGPYINLYGQFLSNSFNIFNSIDYLVIGDGRTPLLRLIDYLSRDIRISEVPNLIYKAKEKIISNSKERYSLEDIPIPDFNGLDLMQYKNKSSIFSSNNYIGFPYLISTGCTNKCSFCNFREPKLEFKSHKKVIYDLNQMKSIYNAKIFRFCDELINNSYEYLEKLCDYFIEKLEGKIYWSVFAKVENLDRHILEKMKKAGCFTLRFGIESGSDKMLKMMNKGFTVEQASKTLKNAYAAGLKNHIYLLAGHPHETQEDIEQTSEFIRSNRKYIHYIEIFNFQLLYGTPIYFNPIKYGITNLTPRDYPYVFAFDEIDGLKWEQKNKQQRHSCMQLIKVAYATSKFNIKFKFLLLFYIKFYKLFMLKSKNTFINLISYLCSLYKLKKINGLFFPDSKITNSSFRNKITKI